MIVKQIVISPGHGIDTKGKRSPDGSLEEWRWNRVLAKKIAEGLDEAKIPYVLLDMGTTDVSLSGRAARANTFGKNCLYISIHGNAAGNGSKWMKARGWSIFTSKGYTPSDPIAEIFIRKAEEILPEIGCKVRKYSSKRYMGDFEENFTVLTKTIMPAILTENLFYDSLEECEIMKSEAGIEALAKIHVEALKDIINKEF